MDDELLAAHVEAIHGVPLDGFVSERDARVRELRTEGHREEATALGRQRKPTVAAWAVNQLPRRHPGMVDDLIAAGSELHSAQVRATSGRGADGLRAATRRVRELSTDLTTRAAAILDEAGSAPHDAEIEQTLFATATDPDRHDDLRRGVLDRAVEVSGFGAMSELRAVPEQGPDDAPEDAVASEEPAAGDTDEEAAEQARQEAARQAARRDLEQRQAGLQRARVRQQRRVDRLVARADELHERLQHLQAEADEAQAAADDARDELERLGDEISGVQETLDGLETSA